MPASGHSTPPPTVLSATALALLRWGERCGVDRGHLLAASGLSAEALEQSDGRVPSARYLALWRVIERATGDADLGLHFAESELIEGEYGVVGFLAMTSPTIGDAVARAVEFQPLIKEHATSQLRHDARGAILQETWCRELTSSSRGSRGPADHALASYMVLGRRWTHGQFAAREVRFSHARPRDTSAYERLFRCPLAFDQPEDALVLGRDALALPLHASQPDLRVYLESLARTALEKRRPGELSDSVREAIQGSLSEAEVGLPRIARRLGLSTRTLQRRLEDQGLVFRDLVDDVRRAEAVTLVRGTDLPLLEVSERLGYSEAKAFRRAFRRWTGVAPADLRRGVRPPRPSPEASFVNQSGGE